MASADNLQYQDIRTKPELIVTQYLAEDLRKNWEKIFVTRGFNTESAFTETSAYYSARKQLWYNGWVTLCGYPGDGKSVTAEHLVCNFVRGPEKFPARPSFSSDRGDNGYLKTHYKENSISEEGRALYDPVWVQTPAEYVAKVKPETRQIVVIEDIFGKAAFSRKKMELWRPHLDGLMMKLTTSRPNTLVVMSVNKAHLEHAPEEISQLEWFRPGVMIDFTSTHKPPAHDKHDMLQKNSVAGYRSLSASEMNEVRFGNAYNSTGLLYRMFSQVKTFQMEGMAFFQSPWRYCENAIDKVFRFDKILYYTLSVAVVLDGTLDLEKASLEEYDMRTQLVMKELIPVLNVPEDVDLAKMRYAAKLLTGFFFQPVAPFTWRFSHDKTFQLCAQSLCRKDMAKILDLASFRFIYDYIRVGNCIEATNELAIGVMVPHYEKLAQRFTLEILAGDMKEIISHSVFGNEQFVKKWFAQLTTESLVETVVMLKDAILNRSLFYWACFYGQGHVVKAILALDQLKLKEEAWFNQEMRYGLQAACATHDPSSAVAVRCLLEQGIDVNSREKFEGDNDVEIFGTEMCYLMLLEAPPIHIAARRGHPDSIRLLLEKGASVSDTTQDGWTPLHRAATRRYGDAAKVIKVLINKKADVNAATPQEMKPLQQAFRSGGLQTIEALVDAGADIKGTMEDSKSFMSLAAMNRQQDVFEYLLKKGIPINHGPGREANFPLHHAIANRDQDFVDFLIRKGVKTNLIGMSGVSPLQLACLMGEKEIVRTLLNDGVDVNQRAHDRKTALHFAATNGHFEIIEMLLEKGAKTELMSSRNETAVVLAARNQHQYVTWLLLKEGMELKSGNAMGSMGMMPIMNLSDIMHNY